MQEKQVGFANDITTSFGATLDFHHGLLDSLNNVYRDN